MIIYDYICWGVERILLHGTVNWMRAKHMLSEGVWDFLLL